jgi:hypothetical protein
MRARHAITLFAVFALAAGCRQLLGIEPATLICPPELPDCTFCAEVKDCGRAGNCFSWSCKDSLCTPVNKPMRTACPGGVCSDDFFSQCVTCMEDEDCPSGGHCGPDRACYRCDDGVQNGRELGIDCGISVCQRCLGAFCATDDECNSGFCVDGVCCNVACDVVCATCDNEQGDCSALPKYRTDSAPVVCAGNFACDGGGSCRKTPGAFCVNPVDCASDRCENNRCAKLAGEPCGFKDECMDDACVNGVCQK